MKRPVLFGVGCTLIVLGGALSLHLLGLKDRPQIGVVAFGLATITLLPGFTMIGKAIWPD